MDLDLLERSRCGDRDAYRALVAAWAQRVLRTATLIAGDRARTEQAVVATLFGVWRDLPTLHSERPFRPWLMRALLAALPEPDADPPDDEVRAEAAPPPAGIGACLAALSPRARSTVVLHLFDQMGATELAMVHGVNLGVAARDLGAALRALTARAAEAGIETDEQGIATLLAEMTRGAELPPWFADELEPRLREPDGPTIRRLLAVDPARAWAQLLDPALLSRWVQADDVRVRGAARLEPGARIGARGRIAGRRASRDDTIVTRSDDRVLAWTTRSAIRPWPSAIEFRWTLQVADAPGGAELVHTLRGVAFPPGPGARFLRSAYERVGGAMPTSMHAGVEQLAQLLEAGARSTSL